MLEKMKRLLLYGGINRQDYLNVYENITESNRVNLLVFSSTVAIGMLVMIVASFFDQSLVKNRIAYGVCAIVCCVLSGLAFRPARTRSHLTYAAVYCFIGLLFIFGIALGTVVEPNELSLSFAVILFAAPLLFTDRPIRMCLAILLGIIAYLYVASLTQDPVMQGYNRSNILPYGLISMVISSYMMQIKISRHVLEHDNRKLIEIDQMTGLRNRRCYEQQISELRQGGCTPGMLVCALDVNGLKSVNDHIGHQAGDELIRGAAACISSAFSPYGTCYRTGGDEFMAILNAGAPDTEALYDRLQTLCSGFRHEQIPVLSLSLGIVAAEKGSDIDQLVREADRRMYRAKADYYRSSGADRREPACDGQPL